MAMGITQRPRISFLGYNKIQDGGRARFWKTENPNNSSAVWAIVIKFGMMVDMDSPQRAVTSFSTLSNPRWRPATILKKKENRHNSAAISDIFAKFGVLVAIHNLQRPVMSFFGYNKIQDQIQDGGRPPFSPKIESGITPMLHKIETWYLVLLWGYRGQKFSLSENARWRPADILDILK